jgi:NodT family efflux transporter outer membrane factor (OMF) lipoprotein
MKRHPTIPRTVNLSMPAIALLAILGGCAVGPDYVRPVAETPAAFREMAGWKTAEPRDHELRGNWWQVFGDPLLDQLQQQVDVSNQNLAAAEARFRQAGALVRQSNAGFFPVLTGSIGNTRSRASSTTIAQPSATPISRGVVTSHSLPFNATWEPDLWGRIGRTVESNAAGAQASAADIESARLSAQAQLAQNYFQLRVLDAQKQLLDDTLAAYERSVQLTQNQYKAGVVARSDTIQAQTQLRTTQAQAIDLGVQRAQLEHAIALLVGKAPADFSIVPAPLTTQPPVVPAGLPSALLERRPDIAAAERRVAAANAQIGVAKAAYFPALTLTGALGYQSASMAQWLTAPSRFWSIGATLAQTIFDGGQRRALTDQAIAGYDANVALYRQTVLTGLQEVEDNLAALRILEEEARVQDEALQLARQSVELATNQYKAGLINFLNVVTLQATALNAERAAMDIRSRRLTASVLLIRALGGGWNADSLPSGEQLLGGAGGGMGENARTATGDGDVRNARTESK